MDIEPLHAKDGHATQKALVPQPVGRAPVLESGNEHPSIGIPFTAIIDGRSYSGSALSLVKAEVSGLASPDLIGRQRIAVLRFEFDGYSLSLPVDVKIGSVNPDKGILALDFIDPTAAHLPTLRYLVNAHIAGDIVSLNSILSMREKQAGTGAPKVAHRVSRLATGLRLATTAVFTLALAGLAASLVYSKLLVTEAPQLARIGVEGQPLLAIASGQIAHINPEARKGGVVYAINSVSGSVLNVTLPCDCTVLTNGFGPGATVLAGDVIAHYVDGPVKPVVNATLSPDMAKQVLAGMPAEIRLGDGRTMSARLAADKDAVSTPTAEGLVTVRLVTDEPLAVTDVGSPATVSIINPMARWFAETLREGLAMAGVKAPASAG